MWLETQTKKQTRTLWRRLARARVPMRIALSSGLENRLALLRRSTSQAQRTGERIPIPYGHLLISATLSASWMTLPRGVRCPTVSVHVGLRQAWPRSLSRRASTRSSTPGPFPVRARDPPETETETGATLFESNGFVLRAFGGIPSRFRQKSPGVTGFCSRSACRKRTSGHTCAARFSQSAEGCSTLSKNDAWLAYPSTNGNAGGKLPEGNTTSRTPALSFSAAAR